MVQKGSKKGLNTGNTIRQHPKKALLHQQQNYGYLTVTTQTNQQHPQVHSLNDLSTLSDHLELSLNKQKRWELPEHLKQTVQAEQDNTEIQITMMEHTLMPMSSLAMQRWDTCDSYYSNLGNVRQCTSNTEMNITSAKQGHRQEDHLSKLERRRLKKLRQNTCSPNNVEENSIPSIEFHVTYGASTNGKLYKNIAKGPQLFAGKQRKQTPGCSKKFRSFELEEEDDMSAHFDEDMEENSDCELSAPVKASLADFLCPVSGQSRHKRRSANSNIPPVLRGKDRVHLIDRPFGSTDKTNSVKKKQVYEAYAPDWCHVSVQREEFESLNLMENFGDKFREACCTPRTFTLDLSEELGFREKRFYLVMAFVSAGDGVDTYRLYCTGDGVASSSSKVACVDSQREYDLVSLKELVLCHGRSIYTSGCEDGVESEPVYRISGRNAIKQTIKSSTLSELVPAVVGEHHTHLASKLNTDMSSSGGLVHMQRSLSCLPHCGVCFEELNDNVLHSALLSCHHYFCNECWTAHINNCIREGLALITCPEYECKKQVDAVFIMSMVEFSTYHLHEIHLTEFTLFSEQRANWCPSKGCGRVLHCDDELAAKKEPITANCKCGTECCFKCLNEPHWPLSCQQLSTYHDKLRESRDRDLLTPNSVKLTLEVATKSCPTCNQRVEKDGGCRIMTCRRCTKSFCWNCLSTEGYNHICGPKTKAKVTSFKRVTFINNAEMAEISKHRLYKAKHNQIRMKKLCSHLLSRTNGKRPLSIGEGHEGQSLKRFFNQIISQIFSTHRLLEYCCAINCFRKGPKYCVPTINTLSYCLEALERELASDFCNQKTLDKICTWYGYVKNNHRLLANKMAALLAFVTPAIE